MKLIYCLFIISLLLLFFNGLVLGSSVPLPETVLAQTVAPVLVGAGDIARCSSDKDEETAQLLDNIAGTVFTLGDNAYPDGTEEQFNDCYDPTWGRHKARTRPASGNHDYHTPGASGFYNYFGAAAGDPNKGYYSYNLGDWHIIVLNTECQEVGGCNSNSPQGQWLQADLAANPTACTLAYSHKPRFSSGVHGNSSSMEDFWQILYDTGADVVLSGHDHEYERFAPQDPNGVADPQNGIRQFVVGTGGTSLRDFATIQPNSEVRNNDTHGVLKLTLHPTSYDWEFIPVAGQTFQDSGAGNCVGAGPAPSLLNKVYLPIIWRGGINQPPPGGTPSPLAIEVRVSASSDDAEENASGSVNLTSTDLELVLENSVQTVGIRFKGISIPQGATVTEAYVQFQVDETDTVATSLTIQSEDGDNAATFAATTNNISARPRTTAMVSWSLPSWTTRGQAGPDQQTPNIAAVIQEIVNRPGWSSGNSLVIIITGTGKRVAEAYDGLPAAAPLLHVEYIP